ncbi:hypothetical protein [Pseudarthrobacter sp. NamB4]|uniref:hypothetical protein n=1 Tax=Pseudarthrobacter sp. NamB4 TaxID=2576837 RepID=UPI001F0ED44D|nr:hypothetical protein [Pseudarthrobacter sp. NamB4]
MASCGVAGGPFSVFVAPARTVTSCAFTAANFASDRGIAAEASSDPLQRIIIQPATATACGIGTSTTGGCTGNSRTSPGQRSQKRCNRSINRCLSLQHRI